MKKRLAFLFLLVTMLPLQSRLWAQSQTTLLATTDLDCTWKLDGKPEGTLKADDATVVPLSLGKHLVQATSPDGLDSWKTVVTITQPGQEMVEIKLKEAHRQRLSETQPAAQPAAQPMTQPTPAVATQPATQPAAQPVAQPETPPATQPTKPAAQPTAAQPNAVQPNLTEQKTPPTENPTWTDPTTHLMWAGRDNGKKSVTWPEAKSYCGSLKLAGYPDWRLPTVNELMSIYDESQDVEGWHIKGGIRVTGPVWSSEGRDTGHSLFSFHNVKKEPVRVIFARHALCVRAATE